MNNLEAIELRHSRRSYLDAPISSENINRLKELMQQYNNLSGLSIQFVENGREAFQGFTLGYGMFHGVQSYFAIVGKNSDIHGREKAGYYGELLILEATKLGLGACWVGGSYNRKRCTCTVHDDESLYIIITVGNIEKGNSFRENAIYRVMHRKTKAIEDFYSSDVPVPDWFLKGMKAVQKAPSAINLQPVHFKYEKGAVTAEVASTEGHKLTDLGIAKLHFEIGAGGKFELGNGSVFNL